MSPIIDIVSGLEATLSLERPRLVGLCARIIGVILSGYLVEWIGIRSSLLILGACYLITTLTLLINPALRKMEKTA